MKIIKLITKFLFLYLALIALFMVSLILVSLIPSETIKDNIKSAIPTLMDEGDYPRVNGKHKTDRVSNYAESIILNIIFCIDESNPIESALRANLYQNTTEYDADNGRVAALADLSKNNLQSNAQYPRYWHGYMVIFRPLLFFIPYLSIRKVLQITFYLLFSIVLSTMSSKLSIFSALAFSLSIILVNISVIPLSIHFSVVFIISFLFMIFILLFPHLPMERMFMTFFIIGALTSFMDLLTAPLVTFGLPAITLLLLRDKMRISGTLKESLTLLLKTGGAWAAGYILLWGTKWILASMIFKENIILQGIQAVTERISHEIPFGEVTHISPLDALIRNIQTLYTYTFTNYRIILVAIPSICFVIFTVLFWHRKKNNLLFPILLMLVGLTPYFWFGFAANHSYIHNYFTFRIQAITIFAFLCAYGYSIDWVKLTTDIKTLHIDWKKIRIKKR